MEKKINIFCIDLVNLYILKINKYVLDAIMNEKQQIRLNSFKTIY
jgi:hypothetical protein